MRHLAVMAQAIDFIEAHLREDVTVSDIAAAVSYSIFHFCRTFNQATHHTPYDYLMRRRLAEAARELLETDKKIIDLTYEYRFASPETFSRAFKRVFDAQPNRWRKQTSAQLSHLMPRLTLAHLEHIAKGPYLKPCIVDRVPLQLTGVMTLLQGDAVHSLDLWRIFAVELQHRGELAANDMYSLTIQAETGARAGRFYLLGIPLTDTVAVNDAWVTKTLPAGKYVRFIHKGFQCDLPLTLDYIYYTWLPQTTLQLAAPCLLIRYGPGFEDAEAAECETYLPVK